MSYQPYIDFAVALVCTLVFLATCVWLILTPILFPPHKDLVFRNEYSGCGVPIKPMGTRTVDHEERIKSFKRWKRFIIIQHNRVLSHLAA